MRTSGKIAETLPKTIAAYKRILSVMLIFLASATLLLFARTAVFAQGENIANNPGFEKGDIFATSWETIQWDKDPDATVFRLDTEVRRSGQRSAYIANNIPNDSRYRQELELDANSCYRFSCWVRTEDVGFEGKGANISIEGRLDCSNDIKGTSEGWKQIEMYCKTGNKKVKINITVGLGGYSSINTGKAWFDDVVVEKIDSIPPGIGYADLSYDPQASSDGPSRERNPRTAYARPLNLFTAFFFAAAVLLYFYLNKRKFDITMENERLILVSILVLGLVFRLYAAPRVEGFTVDINCFKAWALAAAKDLPRFYNTDMFKDYPPFYIYVLFIIGKLANLPSLNAHFDLLVKLPSILADIATAWLLYRFAKKRLSPQIALLAAGVYAFNPAVFINSTYWGQVDSFFTLMAVGALILTVSERLNLAAALMAATVLMKPQGIIIAPVLFFELLRRRDAKVFIKAALSALCVSVLIMLPFSFTQEPLWLIKLYLKTGSEYPYASLNAYNLFSLMGANGTRSDSPFLGLTYGTWGFVFDIAIALFVGYMYYKAKSRDLLPFITAVILNCGAFVMSSSMHERYLFPAVALTLLAFMHSRDRRLAALFLVFSVTVYVNTNDVLYRYLATGNGHIPPNDPGLIVFSAVNVLAFIYLLKVAWDICINNKVVLYDAVLTEKANVARRAAHGAGNGEPGARSRDKNSTGKSDMDMRRNKSGDTRQEILDAKTESSATYKAETTGRYRYDKKDILIMSVMTIVYTIVALINLGSMKAPNTFWEPANAGESVTIDLGRTVNVSRISWYCGINEAIYDSTNRYIIQYLDENGQYVDLGTLEKRDVYKWKHLDVNVTTSRLKFIVQNPHGTINEIGIFEKGKTEPVKGIKVVDYVNDSKDRGRPENLVDEQELVQYWSSYKTDTYFDEVYHARTAYEYLNRIEPMEWTHPPLGKIIISIGIMLFGMNPFGWRIMGTLFGAAMIPVMYMFGIKIFRKRIFGFLAAFLMMFDFMHFAQTRIATIDVYGTFFIILMYYYMYDYFTVKSYEVGFRKSLRPLFWSGLFFGLGAASKWIGIYAGGGLALLFFLAKFREYCDYREIMNDARSRKPAWVRDFIPLYVVRTMLYCVLFFVIIPLIIYSLSYIPYMMVPGRGPEIIIENQKAMFDYHSRGVLGATHAFASQWWSWPFILKPIWYYTGEGLDQGMASSIVSMGNPAIWWAGVVAVVAVVVMAAFRCSRASLKTAGVIAAVALVLLLTPSVWQWGVILMFVAAFVVVENVDQRLGVLFAAMSFQYLPWVFVERLAFIYHFFSTVPFLILWIVYAIKLLLDRSAVTKESRGMAYATLAGYFAAVVVLFIMFYPVLSGMEVPREYIDKWLLWFDDNNNKFLWFDNVRWYF